MTENNFSHTYAPYTHNTQQSPRQPIKVDINSDLGRELLLANYCKKMGLNVNEQQWCHWLSQFADIPASIMITRYLKVKNSKK